MARVVSLPQTVDELDRRIEAFWSVLEGCASLDEIQAVRRIAEFQLLASGEPLIGENNRTSLLHGETLDRKDWDPDQDPAARGIKSLVAVHRLRELKSVEQPCPFGGSGGKPPFEHKIVIFFRRNFPLCLT